MHVFADYWGKPFPAQLQFRRGYGSCLLIDFEEPKKRPGLMCDSCRWVIISQGKLIFRDLDISGIDDVEPLAPYTLFSMTQYPDHLVMDFGDAQLLQFQTEQYHDFMHDRVTRDSQEWQDYSQDERDNLSVFPVEGEAFGIEFETFLDAGQYAWGAEFLRREAELSWSETLD